VNDIFLHQWTPLEVAENRSQYTIAKHIREFKT